MTPKDLVNKWHLLMANMASALEFKADVAAVVARAEAEGHRRGLEEAERLVFSWHPMQDAHTTIRAIPRLGKEKP